MDATIVQAGLGLAAGFAYAGLSYWANKNADSKIKFDRMKFATTFIGAGVLGMLLGLGWSIEIVQQIAMYCGAPVGLVVGIAKFLKLVKK